MKEPILETNNMYVTTSYLVRFSQDESGQDLIEYALLAALVASGSIAGTQNLATKVGNTFTAIQNTLTNSIPSTTPSSGGTGGGTGGGAGGRGGGGRGGRGGGGRGGGGFGGGFFGGGHHGRH